MNFLGLDPGKGGGMVCIFADDKLGNIARMKLADATERDIAEWLADVNIDETCAIIERVASSPQMGVVSAFTFGRSYGFLRGCLSSVGIPFVEVSPQKWQKALGCLSKGNKNITKAKAQQLYPGEIWTHATADAVLLATYLRQNHAQLF